MAAVLLVPIKEEPAVGFPCTRSASMIESARSAQD
eukprot:CAMPEP_0202504636 /NCGR_PEP_ID=MMETSP1361-20130828/45120_1 /ASSEMBLY_ACC=CAM_ASM_000849 /TAXON_ID=210615 /ORGANISM="Staurosira complex sp., Strain CCMP2646" /LENGTH=34 /DNA_ID= /DNA_START= /DNA_END= /DNA_ORIENTATION=